MNHQFFWTKVFFAVFIVGLTFEGSAAVTKSAKSQNTKRAPAQTEPLFDYTEFSDIPTPGPSSEAVLALLRKIATKEANCKRPQCSAAQALTLKQFEKELKIYQELLGHDQYLTHENSALRSQLKTLRAPTSLAEPSACYKKDLIENILIDYGISENGGSIFSKKPMLATDSRCWTNAHKKIPGTVVVCEFPLAIDVQTNGGPAAHTVSRYREYIFDLNGCDLVTAHIRDQGSGPVTETRLSYGMCQEQWNRRTADALMTPQQAELMEDTIGFCFREHLLPPRRSKGGRKNPAIDFQTSGPKSE